MRTDMKMTKVALTTGFALSSTETVLAFKPSHTNARAEFQYPAKKSSTV